MKDEEHVRNGGERGVSELPSDAGQTFFESSQAGREIVALVNTPEITLLREAIW
jgi:hypothetical protein